MHMCTSNMQSTEHGQKDGAANIQLQVHWFMVMWYHTNYMVHFVCRAFLYLYCSVHMMNSTYFEQTNGGATELCADLCVQLKSLLIAQYCICILYIHCIEFWVTNISVRTFLFARPVLPCSTILFTLCPQIVQYNATLILVHVELILCNVLYFSIIAHRK